MRYWLPGSAGSAARLYWEFRYDAAERALERCRFSQRSSPPSPGSRSPSRVNWWSVVTATSDGGPTWRPAAHLGALAQPAVLARDIAELWSWVHQTLRRRNVPLTDRMRQ
jgi:hypothetical protein